MKTVILISASAEWNAVKPLFPDVIIERFPYGESFNLTLGTPALSNAEGWNLEFFHCGWGKIASAGAIQYLIDRYSPDVMINLGTCGGFERVVRQGDIVLVDQTFVYDIVELMGDLDIATYYASSLDLSWLAEPYPHPVQRGMVASADSDLPPDKISFLKQKGAIAADWESAALAWVARKNNARLLILRGVSDIVSEDGGEAYSNIEMFNERARGIMDRLIKQLPDWLNSVKL